MRGGCWLGLDFGTSSVKALLVRDDGSVAGRASAAYPTTYAPGGVAEQEAADYLRAAREAIAACGASRRCRSRDRPRRADADPRAGRRGRRSGTAGAHVAGPPGRRTRRGCSSTSSAIPSRSSAHGCPGPRPMPPAKLLWLVEARAGDRRADALRPPAQGLRRPAADGLPPLRSLVEQGPLPRGDVRAGDRACSRRVGFDPEVAPPLAAAWERRGVVTVGGRRRVRPSRGSTGLGRLERRRRRRCSPSAPSSGPSAFVLSGTSSIVGVTSSRALPAHPAATRAAGGVRTPRRPLRPDRVERRLDRVARPAAALRRRRGARSRRVGRAGSRRPVFVPYLSGERAPVWRTDVRAVVVGLGAEHGPAELARAVVDGVCLSEADVLAVAEEHTGSGAGGRRGRGPRRRPRRRGATLASRPSDGRSTCSPSPTPRRSGRRCSAPPRREGDARRGPSRCAAASRSRPPADRLDAAPRRAWPGSGTLRRASRAGRTTIFVRPNNRTKPMTGVIFGPGCNSAGRHSARRSARLSWSGSARASSAPEIVSRPRRC